jgi:HD-like signal output (HDOD) protein
MPACYREAARARGAREAAGAPLLEAAAPGADCVGVEVDAATAALPAGAPVPQPPETPPTRAERLEACLCRIEASEDFPVLSQQIHDLMAVLGNEDASVQQLANVVLKDYSLTLKVIRAANSFHYNRSGRPILSATHAMVLLGVQAVRNIVSGLVLFDHYQRQSPGLKQLMLLSLLTASHAKEAADRAGVSGEEESYLCGMFRNLGEVLVASHLPGEYAAILREMRERACPDREAAMRVLGFDYDDLAVAMAARWNLPPQVTRVIEAGESPHAGTEQVVAFGHALTGAVYRRDASTSAAGTLAVFQRFGPMLGLPQDDLRAILDVAIAETQSTFRSMGLAIDDLRLRRQMRAALGDDEVPARKDAAVGAADPPPIRHAPASLADEIEAELASGSGHDVNRMLLMALEAVLRTRGFDRVLFALVSPDRGELVGRVALGPDAEALVDRFRFPLGVKGGPLGTAIARRQELSISSAWELRPDEEAWLSSLGALVAGAVPVLVRDVLVGCLYFDRLGTDVPPPERALAMVRRMRDGIARAMDARRA